VQAQQTQRRSHLPDSLHIKEQYEDFQSDACIWGLENHLLYEGTQVHSAAASQVDDIQGNLGVEFCHNLPLPWEVYEALAQGAEHKLRNIFRLASFRSGHRRVAEGPHSHDKGVPTGEDNDP